MAELIKSRSSSYFLHIGGFLYYKNNGSIGRRAYWLCKQSPECDARVVTCGGSEDLRVVKGSIDDHVHAPNADAVEAERVTSNIKKKSCSSSGSSACTSITYYT